MATTPQVSSKSPTIRRIMREAAEMSSSPSADYAAEPLENDLFEWHFTLRGPPGSPYGSGLYHGRILLPPTYPLRPPSFRFTTPNGRFEANREICLSISGHHEETWQPAWGIRTALVALRSFMETDARGQLGGLDTPEEVRRRLATESRAFRCPACVRSNTEIIAESEQRAKEVLSSSTSASDVEVPRELRMGWRDEMEAAKSLPAATQQQQAQQGAGSAQPGTVNGNNNGNNNNNNDDSDGDEEAKLAEGFVQTVPLSPNTSGLHPVPARPMRRHAPQVVAQPLTLSRARTTPPPNDGVPLWIDRSIVALVVVLAALLLKILFGV
ncbi:hypothetical protein CDD82_7574 [Ophiocordyceps australis]|uniref:UBC core domain-containing protein n=1 Tax=Ophiocordyceps australis TaxID=1399860 RepID=A0A2C5ZUM8_9HYPO|nr:hypothetical protein CDD82_7574 [Ophiocordyceps australis]